jgi:hypothetical protein
MENSINFCKENIRKMFLKDTVTIIMQIILNLKGIGKITIKKESDTNTGLMTLIIKEIIQRVKNTDLEFTDGPMEESIGEISPIITWMDM